jgi:hypothetical protein
VDTVGTRCRGRETDKKYVNGRDIRRRKHTAARRRRETDKVVCLFFLILYTISCSAMWTQFRTKGSKNGLTNTQYIRAGRQKLQNVWSRACMVVRAGADKSATLSGQPREIKSDWFFFLTLADRNRMLWCVREQFFFAFFFMVRRGWLCAHVPFFSIFFLKTSDRICCT